ncbi:hemerythrin domain-containing protein [Streptomyces sp. MI02-7b]|uniref:hemerythrin domain-containing protein n=1 Tax=Streptomyces sp. MI02-7b TaxID=462941 RepID=UPI0029B65A9A|nr:hemerythrin domain-containing protein [Streptomyces sp. MI02-7b]MDX3072626.1 hemerythrin domain-containing protein [Streptomyces sp. MI02-7b]
MNEPMADVRDMYMAHTMMRREFRLLPQLVRDVAPGDTGRAEVVAAHADKVCLILHLHHEGEDAIVWPRLLERGGEETAAIVPTMEGQHHVIESALHEATELLSPWRTTAHGGEELADALDRLLTALLEHMALEEKEILPLAEKYITAAEWQLLGEHGMAGSPKKVLPLAFGMVMYEGDPEVVKAVLAHAPFAARLIMPIIGPRLYASHARRVYGTSTPPRVGT